jgi:hypothetical protein
MADHPFAGWITGVRRELTASPLYVAYICDPNHPQLYVQRGESTDRARAEGVARELLEDAQTADAARVIEIMALRRSRPVFPPER